MLQTYKILSLLLDYPDDDLYDALDAIPDEVKREGLLTAEMQQQLTRFLDACKQQTLEDWQMMYVNQFDTSRSVNLYLFDHIYGDSRERGQAMVNLKEMYEGAGYQLTASELPDFLPVFLEFLAFQDNAAAAARLLKDIKAVMEKLYKQLTDRNVFYNDLMAILIALADSDQQTNTESQP